jgi:methionine-rich copper-binding protein CopC
MRSNSSRTPNALKPLLAAAFGAALALSFSTPASAHAGITGSDPEDGAAVEVAPASVSATFSENLDGPSTEIAVTGPDGAVIEAGEPVYEGDTFTQSMIYSEPGQYVVAYRVISEDGHRIDGSITFTVAEIPAELLDAPAEAATSAEAAPSEPEPTTAAETETSTSAADSGSGAAVIAGVLLAVLVIAVGIAVLVRARRRRADAE